MKNTIIVTGFSATLLLAAGSSLAATIQDTFWGGVIYSSKDKYDVKPEYVGDSLGEVYDVSKMDVNFSGSLMTVDIYSRYAAQLNSDAVIQGYTKPGDLFISTGGWSPVGTGPQYREDVFGAGTSWNYAVHLSGQTAPGERNATSGTAELYAVQSGEQVTMSGLNGLDPAAGEYIYRQGQAVSFNTAGAQRLAVGTWDVSAPVGALYGKIGISIDYTAMLHLADAWAFHWTMSCGNDVIEGAVDAPVPEPSAILLLSFGVAGVMYAARRTKVRNPPAIAP